MSEGELAKRGFIPTKLPLYYAPWPPSAAADTYQNALTEAAKRLNSIAYVLNEGVREVLAVRGADPQAISDAMTNLDCLLTPTVEPGSALYTATREIVDAFAVKANRTEAPAIPRATDAGTSASVNSTSTSRSSTWSVGRASRCSASLSAT